MTDLTQAQRLARAELAARIALGIASSGTWPSEKAFKGADKMSAINRCALVAYKLADALTFWEAKSLEQPKESETVTTGGL